MTVAASEPTSGKIPLQARTAFSLYPIFGRR
jgi:hypothetical protein